MMHLTLKALLLTLSGASSVLSLSIHRRACTFEVTAVAGDTCASLASAWGITLADFLSYNPSAGANCANGVVPGTDYCVEVDLASPTTTTTSSTTTSTAKTTTAAPTTTKPTTSSGTTTTTTTAPAGPSPTQDGIISTCTAYYKVVSGDSCQKIVDSYGTFTLANFYAWNPAAGSTCSGLWVDYYVCVGVPGTPTTKPTTSTTTTATTTKPAGPSPTQDGIVSTCKAFYSVVPGDTCQKIVDSYGTFTLDSFYAWNPAVGRDCSGLWAGYYVCVGIPGTPTTKPATPTTTTAAPGPSPTQTGITAKCSSYYMVKSGDTCQKIVNSNAGKFTLAQFYSWNPAVKSDCSALWVGYYVCIGSK